jgi:Amidohydrolase family
MKPAVCLLPAIALLLISAVAVLNEAQPRTVEPLNVEFVNGQWFNGSSFEHRTMYSVNGHFTLTQPAAIDRTLNLEGTWIVPPFADAHNHNVTGIEARDRPAIQKYLSDGVFYVKIQGNLPLTDETKDRLSLNRPGGIDVALAQGSLTASGGHPIPLSEGILFAQGMYPGHTRETLKDHLYFTIDSEADLDAKWPRLLGQRPDFIKTFLLFSEEFEKRKADPAYAGQKGLDPGLLPKIVAKAHASGLRVSTHVATATDFHHAVAAGVDEIAHLPAVGKTTISAEHARRAAMQRTLVVSTYFLAVPSLIRMGVAREADVRNTLRANLRILHENGVAIAIGSDNVNDSSVAEVEALRASGVFDNLTLLKMCTETTPQSIFPKRKIGALSDGSEASFLALDGNPLDDLHNVRRIRVRVKQGFLLEGTQK